MKNFKKLYSILFFFFIFLLFLPFPLLGYIGPGAGFALVSSLFTLLISFILAFFSLLTFPVRYLFRSFKNRKHLKKLIFKRVVIIGLDGLDYELTQKYMDADYLPNFRKLKQTGGFQKLKTTYPSISPVAWSSFATGVNPGKHNIFDFLISNPRTYLPELSSSRVTPSKKNKKFGKYQIPLGKAKISFLRKSKSFWSILGEHGIFSHIIRIPITFPPEKFYGAMLSAMCTPDLRGTQGSFTFYSAAPRDHFNAIGGNHIQFSQKNGTLSSYLVGPENAFRTNGESVRLPFSLKLKNNSSAELQIKNKRIELKLKEFSPYIPVSFPFGFGVSVKGICQFYLKQITPEVQLYVSPIQIDPEKPALPVSHPKFFATYLAKLLDRYNTLGLSEDTWALNEQVLDEKAFLKQAYQIHEEREKQFFHVLNKTKRGVCACVFDGTDRIQHMFFRYLIKDHPAHCEKDESLQHAIRDIYQRSDALVGRVLEKIDDDTVLFVISDHGFKSFQRGINLNSWLHQNGYLTLKEEQFDQDYFQNVDWENTKAYAVGLAGIYLNLQGREHRGTVSPGEAEKALKDEIIRKLSGLKDPDRNVISINRVIDKYDVMKGPYIKNAPDLIIGYHDGYRISWDGAVGKTTQMVFEDNTKAWSGDHGIDPDLVPGVIFSNQKLQSEEIGLMDLAPTVLNLFKVPIPKYMDGKPISMNEIKTTSHTKN